MTAPPGDARRMWADHYAAVRARIAQGRAPAHVKPPKPVAIVRLVIDRAPPPKTPARAPREPPPPLPLPTETLAALPRAKPRVHLSKDKRELRKLEAQQQKEAHATAVAALPERFAELLDRHQVTWKAIRGASQSVSYIRPRLEIYRALLADGWSYSAIARACNRDHSSIIHYIQKWGTHD